MGLTITRSNCPCCGNRSISKALVCKDYTVTSELFEIWQCADCGMRFTQEVPDQDSIGPYYQSDTYISHSDTGKGLVNKLYKMARNYTLNWKFKLVKLQTGHVGKTGSLLDIGAGTGAFLNTVGNDANWSVTGLEPDAGARKVCNEKYSLRLEPSEKLFELPSEKFDAVTMWHVLEHVHQLQEYMQQIKRLLKPNGVAFIALPNYTSKDAQHYAEHWAAYDVPRHLYHFSPQAVRKLATRNGLAVKATKPMWLDAFYIAMLSEQYKNGKGNLFAAVINGLKSNFHAWRNKEACSSLVYVITR
ncbi:MAG: class I SAM-dependent methyltransferase [Bacteroidota bacterium]